MSEKMFEMNEMQKGLFDDLTPLRQEVALGIIKGMSNIDAYRASRGEAKTIKAMESSVSKMLSLDKVKAFIDAMKQVAVSEAVMGRQEMMERLSGMARTNMNDLISWASQESSGDEGEMVEQSSWQVKDSALQDPLKVASISEVTAGKEGFKIKQHSPLAAMKQLAELAGYEAPKQLEVIAKEELTPWGKITASED